MAKAKIASCALSRAGVGRHENQDAVRICDLDHDPVSSHGYLFALADGMGGYEQGDVASHLALEHLFGAFYGRPLRRPSDDLACGMHDANERVYQTALERQVCMGTTLTALHIMGHVAHIAHVGDSRAYLVRHQRVRCLTNDHTPPGDLVRLRLLSPAKVRGHASRSLLNRSIGLGLFVRPDLNRLRVRRDDLFVLCCDGVWSVIEDHEFGEMAISDGDLSSYASQLVDLAASRGGDDDLSVVVIRVLGLGATQPKAASVFRGIGRSWSQRVGVLGTGPCISEDDRASGAT